ncbi:MAG: MlaE family lipid ABC transporter permease subunit [Bauldia sp.]
MTAADAVQNKARLIRTSTAGQTSLAAVGVWSVETVASLEREIEAIVGSPPRAAVLDLSGLTHIDTAGAWLISRLWHELTSAGAQVTLTGVSENARRLIQAVEAPAPTAAPPATALQKGGDVPVLSAVGRRVVDAFDDFVGGLSLLGGAARGLARALLNPSRFRPTSIVYHLDRTGLQAVPIVTLISFLIGGIIAQQGAFQLQRFGADLFVVDLVGILVLREIGVLLTAIMIAGRSGSAYTAEIGSMKMREEIDALHVIGLDPADVLILPRLIALVMAMPLLTFIADLSALVGGAFVSFLYINVPFETFISRLRDAVAFNTLAVGLIKAPFMGLIIGVIAANEGLRVRGSAESLGVQTTASVVKSIFMVIVADGLFAIFFASVKY